MDILTDSDSQEDDFEPATSGFNVRSTAAFVTWRNASNVSQSLSDLELGLFYDSQAKKAFVKLRAGTKLKKGTAKPTIFLFVNPEQIKTVECISWTDCDTNTKDADQVRHGQEKLNTATYALQFVLRNRPTFVVPADCPYKYFRAGSQAVWRSFKDLAKEAVQFTVHFPARTLSKARLEAFCHAASDPGNLTAEDDCIGSLYGGKGGRMVDLFTDDDGEGGGLGSSTIPSTVDNDAPPAYEARTARASASSAQPPLCLSPEPPKSLKRRRRTSSPELDSYATDDEKTSPENKQILQIIARLQETIQAGKLEQDATLTKILAKVETIESRISRLEEEHHNLTEEVKTHVEPLWDEMSTRLQSQEDREHDYILDMIEEAFEEKIDEKIPLVVDQYFRNDDEGHNLVTEVVSERIREETRDFLRSQQFTGRFTIADDE